LKKELGLTSFHRTSYPVPAAPAATAAASSAADVPDETTTSTSDTIASGWSTPEAAPNSWINLREFSSSAKWAAHIKSGVEESKHYDGQPRWMSGLKSGNFAHENSLLVKAASASDKAAWAYLENVTNETHSLPDVDTAASLVKTCLSSSWVNDRAGKYRVAGAVFGSLTLSQLREIKGFFSNWGEDVEMSWLKEIITRLTPPSGVDLTADEAAMRRYCDQVWEVLDKTSAAESAANEIKVCVAYHRLRLAYSSSASSHTWNSEVAKQCLLDLVKIPLRGIPWEKSDSKGFFATISNEWWLRHSGYASNLQRVSDETLALPTVTKDNLVDAVTAALLEILGADRSVKPSTKKDDSGSNLGPWEKYMSLRWLSSVQAAGQILSGKVDPVKWQQQLQSNNVWGGDGSIKQSWSTLEEIRNDSYLRFSPGNKEVFSPWDSDVAVSFDAKNITKLSVKLFELNTTAYYSDKRSEIPSDIQLDGLQPFESSELDLEAQAAAAAGGSGQGWSPFVSTRVKLPLTSLCGNTNASGGGNRRGVFVVELTGGSISCRALIRIGSLRIVERKTISGHIVTVLDEKNNPLGADPTTGGAVTVTVNGRRYSPLGAAGVAEAAGGSGSTGGLSPTDILIPYATSSASGTYPMIITLANPDTDAPSASSGAGAGGGATTTAQPDAGWSFSTLVPGFKLSSESYTLEASFTLDRESLVKDNYSSSIVVRPRLLLHGVTPAPLATLVNVSLTLTSIDAEGSSSTRVFKPFVLNSDSDSVVPFSVPPGLRSLTASLSADYETSAEPGKKNTLSCQRRVDINGIDGTSNTRGVFLRKINTGGTDGYSYAVYLLGKTGEPVPGVSLSITLNHLHLSSGSFYTYLTTDQFGAVYLGPLHGYSTVSVSSYPLTGTSASSSGGSTGSATFELPSDTTTFPSVVHTSTVGDGGAFWNGILQSSGSSISSFSATPRKAASGVPFALQAALPFRPPMVDDSDKPVDKTKYVISRRDISIIEVRPKPSASKRGGGFINSSNDAVRVNDMINEPSYQCSPTESVTMSQLASLGMHSAGPHACYDYTTGFIYVHGLPAGEYELRVKRPYPGSTQPSPVIRIRVLPAPQRTAAEEGGAAAAATSDATSTASEAPARLVGGFLASGNAALEVHSAARRGASATDPTLPLGSITPVCPLQVSSVSIETGGSAGRELVVRVSGGVGGPRPARGKDVRLHVVASYFTPSSTEWECGASFSKNLSYPGASSTSWGLPRSRYLASRTLSEETKYVLDRQNLMKGDPAAQPTPGNLLPRPSLLMNPWSLGPADSSVQDAKDGSNYASHADGAYASASTGAAYRQGKQAAYDATSYAKTFSIDFLTRPSFMLLNQKLGASPATGVYGEFRLPLSTIAMAGFTDPRQAASWDCHVTVIAADTLSTAASHACVSLLPEYQKLNPGQSALAQLSQPFRDLTKGGASNMPLDAHVVHSSRIKVLAAPGNAAGSDSSVDIVTGGAFVQIEPYGSLDKVFSLFASLATSAGNSTLASQLTSEWQWLLTWPALSDAEKQAKYSKYACHEVNLFLFCKDQPFFNRVVRPYLKCKRAKSFLDRWLLNEDVSGFNDPAAFERLNALEKALLAARLGNDKTPAGVASLLRDEVDVNPTSITDRDAVFKAALASEGLGSEDSGIPPPAPPPPAPSAYMSAPSIPASYGAAPGGGFGGGGPRSLFGMAAPSMAMESCPPPPPAPCAAPMPMASAAPPSMARRAMAAPAPMERMKMKRAAVQEKEMAVEEECDDAYGGDNEELAASESYAKLDLQQDYDEDRTSGELALRGMARRIGAGAGAYRKLEKTEEYAEQHYWKLMPNEKDGANGYKGACYQGVVQANEFWADFAVYCSEIAKDVALDRATRRRSERKDADEAKDEDLVAEAMQRRPFVSSDFGVVGTSSTVWDSLTLNRMLLALAVLGLPLERSPEQPPSRPAVAAFSSTASASSSGIRYSSTGTPLAVFYQSMEPAGEIISSTVLLGQQYYDPSDRYETVKGVRNEKYLKPLASASSSSDRLTFEMLEGRVYGCCTTITNVSAQSVNLEVLLTIPRGSLPASNGFFSRTQLVELSPFNTRRIEYSFYYPKKGKFGAFPAHAGSDGELLAYAKPSYIKVVNALTSTAAAADWPFIAANGTVEAVCSYLSTCNLYSVDIKRIFWRLNDKASWTAIIGVLRTRQHFVEEVWQHSFEHGDVKGVKEYINRDGPLRKLRNNSILLASGNPVLLTSPLITLRGEEGVGSNSSEEIADDLPIFDPSLRSNSVSYSSYYVPGHGYTNVGNATAYAHLEYSPLVQARAHVLGTKRKILNAAVDRQWRSLLTVLACKPPSHITTMDKMAVVYHLLLQDRVPEAKTVFATIPAPVESVAAGASLTPATVTRATSNWQVLPYDYMAGYLDLFSFSPAGTATADWLKIPAASRYPVATAVAKAYKSYPVPKWASKFQEMAGILEEADTNAASSIASSPTATIGSGVSADETGVSKELSRESQANKAASKEPQFELKSLEDGGKIVVSFANLHNAGKEGIIACRCYRMDLEVLFSADPFATAAIASSGGSSSSAATLGQFAYVRPNGGFKVPLPAPITSNAVGLVQEHNFTLPEAFSTQNTMVELVANPSTTALRRCKAYFANSINVTVNEAYGRLTVTHKRTGAPLARVYVKVFFSSSAYEQKGEKGRFYKDGYTSAGGSFDYASLSTDEANQAKRFAILVSSSKFGSTVLTVSAPAQ
jgi:hypothetical protein